MATYYDLILASIPLVLVGLGGALHLAGLDPDAAVAVAGLVALGLVGHALFVKAPVETPSRPKDETVDTSHGPVSLWD